jgi:phage-related protein
MSTQYSFTIPQALQLGNTADKTVVADRGLSRQVSFAILRANFGDGYSQRARDGINSKREALSISFNNRDYKEGNLIAKFLDNRQGLNFDLTLTDTAGDQADNTEVLRVTCDGYNLIYINDTTVSIQATFNRVYEPPA